MSTNEMRMWLVTCYPGSKSWATRVSRMSDNQIYAVYRRLSARRSK